MTKERITELLSMLPEQATPEDFLLLQKFAAETYLTMVWEGNYLLSGPLYEAAKKAAGEVV